MSREIVDKILMYIDEHIYEKINLSELADIAGYSPFYFSALFSETMGISVTAYIRIRKLQHALVSLLAGDKIVDISLKYAFESHEGFTRSFTKLFGSTPKTVRKYLTTYTVPKYVVPENLLRKENINMKATQNLVEDMHRILFAFLQESIEEAKEGHCTEINIEFLPDNQVKVSDNGRGIPLSDNPKRNQEIVAKILAGHPITKLEYERMEPLPSRGLQVANSLCEKLSVVVYRNGNVYKQDFVRGIAQHEVTCEMSNHESGMEVTLVPDREIFGDMTFSKQLIEKWISENSLDKLIFY